MTIRAYTDYREAEITALYAAVGWSAYTGDPAVLRRGFEGSLLVLAAYEDDTLAGIARAVGDAATVVYIQDILVHPGYRRRGIGSALLNSILEKYSGVRQVVLVTDDTPETAAFYRSAGFTELSGMHCVGFMRISGRG